MNILIIGNSAAGTAAIEAIRAHDLKSSIVQLSEEAHPLYSRCLLSYYLAGAIDRNALRYREADFHQRMRVDLRTGRRVVAVDAKRQQVTCDDGGRIPFDRLLIATGSSAKLPDHMNKGIDGIRVLRTIDDAEILRKAVTRAKRAVVLGGGLIGMKAACALKECGLDVTVIIGSNRVLSQMIDADTSRILIRRLTEMKIEVLLRTDISDIQSRQNQLTAVVTAAGNVIPCDLLVVAKGVQPNRDLVQDTDIQTRSGIETNAYMQTNHDNIYAAGDVAESLDITTGESALHALWTCAVQQGRIAGLHIIGKKVAYDGAVGMNSISIGGLPLISYGITSPQDASAYRLLTREKRTGYLSKRIILRDNQIKGIVLLGKIENAGVLLSLLRQKADVSSFEQELLDDDFHYAAWLGHGGPPVLEKYRAA